MAGRATVGHGHAAYSALEGEAVNPLDHPALIIHVQNLSKDYSMGENVVHALRGVSLDVYPGELVAVMGASGSGKSTFMNLLGCLDRSTSGTYLLEGIDTARLNGDELAAVQIGLETLLRAQHHLTLASQTDAFRIFSNQQMVETIESTTQTLTFLLGGVAAVSLVVGGIGIMNIMLVSVTERTREIGIPLAVGARQGNILTQFLIEAVFLSVVGGVLGILFGVLGSSQSRRCTTSDRGAPSTRDNGRRRSGRS
jgi:ABC-type antimicrobial peptide transport system permease subunit